MTATKSQRKLTYNRLTGTLHVTDNRGRETGYYLDVLPTDFGPDCFAVTLTKIVPPEDGAGSYPVLIGPDFDSCECLGYLRHGHCKHVAALRRLRSRGSI